MVRVATRGRFSIYVYAEIGQPHHLPHCDVRWSDGNAQVALRSRTVLVGGPLPAAAARLLYDEYDKICAAWDALNPGRPAR
ncbi:MAG: DUF4160 domain-containing protein [Dehalococcoidia bacterium]